MAEASQFSSTCRKKYSNLLAARVAGAQWGVIGCGQLNDCGVKATTASRWRTDGKLHLVFPGVYALGHPSIPIEGQVVAGLIYAGEGAALSHATAAWWWGLVDYEPQVVELSSTRRIKPSTGLIVHQRRRFESTRHRRFPVTRLEQTFLDFAATASLAAVRRVLAEADYRRLLDSVAAAAVAGQGRPGSARLRKALHRHQPRLARTRSGLERDFIALCETAAVPLPEINVRVVGWPVDALWREERVIVELDGHDNHSTRAQIERDRRKELELRAAGFFVVRYAAEQVTEHPEVIVADLLSILAERNPLNSPAPSA